jgi:hypothetical protein
MQLRQHQIEKSKQLLSVLQKYGCAYLAGEVRSGKTLTVLETAKIFGAENILFLTKKKAISSIQSDFDKVGYSYNITITNYESIHKIESNDFDLIIYDESHCLSGFPKPAKRTKQIKERFYNVPCIWLSGTPAAESYSQYYHQFFVNVNSPFKIYSNFYKWSKDFVNITKKRIGTHEVNDYTGARVNDIKAIINPYIVVMTQNDAGFDVNIKEHILTVPTPNKVHLLVERLIKERAIEGKKGFIMAEMPAKLQSKVHQIYNGTVILETLEGSNLSVVLSDYKARFIRDSFKGKKIAIMYYYQAELEILKNVFGNDITADIEEFNSTNKNFAIQQGSTEGMNISKAECLVYYNFHFSGKNYIQSRDRLTIKGRENNDVYFILEDPGINKNILKSVRNKKDYSLKSFKTDFL